MRVPPSVSCACYAPNSSSARNIADNLAKQKVSRGQADRIVLNLDDTRVGIEAMKRQFIDWPIPGIKEVIAIKVGGWMGLDNSLALSTDLEPAQALNLMADRFALERGDDTHLIGPALWVSAIKLAQDMKRMIEEGFHFSPDLSVGFRLDTNSDDYEEGSRVMIRATMLLLEHSRDAVLLFNGEHIILQRLGGRLTLNADYGNWTGGLRLENEIRLPYEKRPLPSPLL